MSRLLCVILFVFIGGTTSAQNRYTQLQNFNWDQLQHHFDSLKLSIGQEKYTDSLQTLISSLKTTENYRLETIAIFFLAQDYFNNDKLARSVSYFRQGLVIAEEKELTDMIAQFHLSLGGVMSRLFKKDDELKNYLKAYDIFLKTDTIKAATTQYAIANVYYSIGSYQESIRHGHIGLKLFRSQPFDKLNAENQNNYMSLLNTIGIAYRELKNYDSAIYYLNRSFDEAVKQQNTFWQNLIYGNLGSIYLSQKEYDKALALINKDYKTSLQYHEYESAAIAAISLGQIYFGKNDLKTAKVYYGYAKQIIDERNMIEAKVKYLQNIYQWYEAAGLYQDAYEQHKNFIDLRDSLNAIKNKVELSKIKAAYDFDQQVAEIDLLTKNNQLQENAIEKQSIIIVASALLLLLIIAMSIYMYHNLKIKKRDNRLLQSQRDQITEQSQLLSEKNKTIESINKNLELEVEKRTRKLKQVNKELDTFLYRASHDIRQPIATILGLEHLARNFVNNEDMETILEKLNSTANGMDLMLSKLQMIYHLNHNKDVSKLVDIKVVTDSILTLYQDSIQRKGIEITNTLPNITIKTIPDLLNIILRNLIENAIYFSQSDQNSFIHVYIEQDKSHLTICVEDNGYGIEEEFQKQIFNAYFKGNEHSKGNGLGLYISQKAAQTLGVTIMVHSSLNKGSKFSISIPFKAKKDQADIMVEIPKNN